MTTKKSHKATKTAKSSTAAAALRSTSVQLEDSLTAAAKKSSPKAKAPQPASPAAPTAETKANPFTGKAKQDIQLHTSRNADQDKLVTRSFTIYTSDDHNIKDLTEELNKYSRKKVNNSLVVRTAINHLRETLRKGGARFEQDLERLIKDSI